MKIIFISLLLAVLLLCVVCSPAADCIDRSTVSNLDLGRFAGRWYEIARFDHRFERDLDSVSTDYTIHPDGRITVENRGVNARTGKPSHILGKAYATKTPGKLRVSFFWFFYSDYNILEIGDNYDWMLIGSKSPKYLWILARKPHLDIETTNHILQLARKRGYPTSQLIFIDRGGAQ